MLALWFVTVAIAVGAHRNVPTIDDWTYAWSVERLVRNGSLEVLDWSAVYPLSHVLWGSAWSLVFGFSFLTLRLSTLALALLAACALYLILRELDATKRVAFLGALTFAANPVVLLLSSSFMSDMPFVACTLMALLCYIRAMRRGRVYLVWWGGAWALAAFFDRQIGVLTPLAALPLLVRQAHTTPIRRWNVLLAVAVTWTAMFVGSIALMAFFKPTGEMMKLVDRLNYVLQIPLTTYVTYNLYVLCTIAFYSLPALLAMATVRGLWRTRFLFFVTIAVLALLVGFTGEVPSPLRAGGTWTLVEVGGSRGLINGSSPDSRGGMMLEIVLRASGLLALALAMLSLRTRDDASTNASGQVTPVSRRFAQRLLGGFKRIPITTRTPLVFYLLGYLVLANVLWMYNDRYLIVLVPLIVALALGARQRADPLPRLACVALTIFAVIAVAGTRDALRFNQSVRDSWQTLVNSGVRPSDIDAGYAWTGWVLYAHPQNLAKGMTVNDVPWVTSNRRALYILSKSPLEGYDVARVVNWHDDAPWPGPDQLLVLKRRTTN